MSRKSKKKPQASLEDNLNLKKDFPPITYEDWEQGAIKDLKGKSFERELFADTYEKIKLHPIYTKEDIKKLGLKGSFPGIKNYVRGTKAEGYIKKSWDICQEISVFSAEEFNLILKHDLKRGQTAVFLIPDMAFQLGKDADDTVSNENMKRGVPISHLNDFLTALSGIDLHKNPIHINPGFSSLITLMMLTAFAKKEKMNGKKIRGSIQGDPLGFLIQEGRLPIPKEKAFDQMEWSVRWAKVHFPHLKTVGVNAIPYHDSGGSVVEELAFSMATAVEYINQLQNRGLDLDDIAQNMVFTFAVGPFFFMEIAKLRSARILWSKIISEYGGGGESQKINIHARTSNYNQCVYDPYVNMLRTTTESLSAIIGGTDSLHTSAFNESFTQPDHFSRRIARNTQLILEKEVHLRNPIDPAGGSYYIETLTFELARKAWLLFQEIEKMGGMFKAIQKEFPQKKIEEVATEKNKDIASRKTVLVGTNMYANVHEKIRYLPDIPNEELKAKRRRYLNDFRLSRDIRSHAQGLKRLSFLLSSGEKDIVKAGIDAFFRGATVGEIAKLLNHGKKKVVAIKKLNVYRLAEVFERLRLRVENYREKRGSRPKIFLFLWGGLHQYQARAEFSRGFFEIAGCEVVDSSDITEVSEITKSIINFQAQIVVFCSSDDLYPQIVPEMSKELKKKIPEIIIVVAGKPKKEMQIPEKVKINDFIYQGVNLPVVLTKLMKKIGVELP